MTGPVTTADAVNWPSSDEELTHVVATLQEMYPKIQNAQHASAIILARAQHAGPHEYETTYTYLANCILKNIAYQYSQRKQKELEHSFQVDQLIALLRFNPDDQEARDHLEKFINDGSVYAKQELAKIEPKPDLRLLSLPAEEGLASESQPGTA